jgi:hypothetical protein
MRIDADNLSPEEAERQRRKLREAMFLQVAEGDIEPELAEEIAADFGFGPLATPVDPEAFDYSRLDREFWTFGMAVCWLAWRRPEAVRECFPGFVDGARVWKQLTKEAAALGKIKFSSLKKQFVLVKPMVPTVVAMVLRERRGQPPIEGLPTPPLAVADALGLLVGELLDSRTGLVVYASKISGGETVALPNAAWDVLGLSEVTNILQQGADALFQMSTKEALYLDMRIRQSEVLAIWPRLLGEQQRLLASSEARAEMRQSLQPSKSKSAAVRAARHSPQRAAIDNAVAYFWEDEIPLDIPPLVMVDKVLKRLQRLNKDRGTALPSQETILKRINELTGLRRANSH